MKTIEPKADLFEYEPIKRPAWKTLSPEIQATFRPYWSSKTELNMAYLLVYDPALLSLARMHYPEIDAIDWENMTFDWVKTNWVQKMAKLEQRQYRAAQKLITWPQDYREICMLPKREYARAILSHDHIFIPTLWDVQQLEVWAGYAKPTTERQGNVIYLKR
jgi:hypothetical protein